MIYEEMHGTPERPADATRKFREVTAELKEILKDVDGVWDPRMDKAIGRALSNAKVTGVPPTDATKEE